MSVSYEDTSKTINLYPYYKSLELYSGASRALSLITYRYFCYLTSVG